MSSWKNIIKKTTDFLFRTQLDNTKKYQLIDIGSGKGKVLCVWSKMFHKKKNVSLLGVEYSQELNNICINNLKKMPYVNYKISNEDALEVNFIKDNYINIFYLYNPFSEKVLNKFIRKIKCYFCYVIYVNPAHEKLFIQNNFSILLKKNAWHPNASYTIFKYEKNNEE
jgi:16S rRNA A1518/A1519 N6-dimethyltransferase RsmA/KsgA/DIM1 with predicted DNA glycosylase/AP lyase activity